MQIIAKPVTTGNVSWTQALQVLGHKERQGWRRVGAHQIQIAGLQPWTHGQTKLRIPATFTLTAYPTYPEGSRGSLWLLQVELDLRTLNVEQSLAVSQSAREFADREAREIVKDLEGAVGAGLSF